MTPILRPIAYINRLRFLLYKNRVVIKLVLSSIILLVALFILLTPQGEVFYKSLVDTGRWYYLSPLVLFLVISLVFSMVSPIVNFLHEFGKYLFIHNLDDFESARNALNLFVWTRFKSHIKSPYFCICLLTSFQFFETQLDELHYIALTLYVFFVISLQVWELLKFCFNFNEKAFRFYTFKSQMILRQLKLDLYLFEKRFNVSGKYFGNFHKEHDWNWREEFLIWFDKTNREFNIKEPKKNISDEYLALLWNTGHFKISSEKDIDLVKGHSFYKYFFLFFLGKFGWFFILLSTLLALLLNVLYQGSQLSFNINNPNYGIFDMLYFWLTSLNTIGYGDMSLQRTSFISYVISLFIVSSPLILVTLILFIYSSLLTTNFASYADKAVSTIKGTYKSFLDHIKVHHSEVLKHSAEKETQQIDEMLSKIDVLKINAKT